MWFPLEKFRARKSTVNEKGRYPREIDKKALITVLICPFSKDLYVYIVADLRVPLYISIEIFMNVIESKEWSGRSWFAFEGSVRSSSISPNVVRSCCGAEPFGLWNPGSQISSLPLLSHDNQFSSNPRNLLQKYDCRKKAGGLKGLTAENSVTSTPLKWSLHCSTGSDQDPSLIERYHLYLVTNDWLR